jgi:hypothetical protein
MNDIYLTDNLKNRYMHDFEDHVLLYDKENAWKLDSGLAGSLISINKNPHIQTLYSKKDSFANVDYLHESYLEFCYSSNVELKIFREIIPQFSFDFIREFRSAFYYQFNFPRQNPNFAAASDPVGLDCIDDENYFKINTIRLTLESPIKSIHAKFWHTIEYTLAELEPLRSRKRSAVLITARHEDSIIPA